MCHLKAHFEQNMAHHALSDDDCRTRPDMAIREGFLSACLFCAADTCDARGDFLLGGIGGEIHKGT